MNDKLTELREESEELRDLINSKKDEDIREEDTHAFLRMSIDLLNSTSEKYEEIKDRNKENLKQNFRKAHFDNGIAYALRAKDNKISIYVVSSDKEDFKIGEISVPPYTKNQIIPMICSKDSLFILNTPRSRLEEITKEGNKITQLPEGCKGLTQIDGILYTALGDEIWEIKEGVRKVKDNLSYHPRVLTSDNRNIYSLDFDGRVRNVRTGEILDSNYKYELIQTFDGNLFGSEDFGDIVNITKGERIKTKETSTIQALIPLENHLVYAFQSEEKRMNPFGRYEFMGLSQDFVTLDGEKIIEMPNKSIIGATSVPKEFYKSTTSSAY